jgi:catechol 2,3-dioxygenase-like lactoylglutathione lyase family enzyme
LRSHVSVERLEQGMIDHMGVRVRDLAASRRFYDACAAALGLQTIDNTSDSFLLGRSAGEPVPFVWIGTASPAFWTAAHSTSASPIHLAFKARDRAAVDAFHTAGLAAGGTDNGAPGLRGPAEMDYYAAFVLDPDGNNIEAGVRK